MQAALSVLGAWPHSAEVAKAALGALRQLSNSDTVKKLLAESGGIEKVRGAWGGSASCAARGGICWLRAGASKQ